MNQNPYRQLLLKQRENILRSPALRFYFQQLYENIQLDITRASRVLEVGAGSGVSEIFLTHQNLLRTDYYAFPEFNVDGACLMEELPFEDSEFSAVLAVDTIHHSLNPVKALYEMFRVLSPGGAILIIEPFVSAFSYIPYLLLHNEATSWRYRPITTTSRVSTNHEASDGDQGVSRFLISEFEDQSIVFHSDTRVEILYLSWLDFFLTGGVNRRIPVPSTLIKLISKLERNIPQRLMRFLASRVVIKIYK